MKFSQFRRINIYSSHYWHILSIIILFLSGSSTLIFGKNIAGSRGLMRYPDLHGDKIVFTSSGDLWLSSINGGIATRITAHEGEEKFAKFSPDGKWIAFSGKYYGNSDIYAIPVTGGEPRQLTFHSSVDDMVGWSKDGNIIFRSRREPPYFQWQLYTVTLEGSNPERLPYKRAANITYEPNGKRSAIVPIFFGYHPWKRYRGGWREKIWVGNPDIPEYSLVNPSAGNTSSPMWADDGKIYFVSDSTGRSNFWSMTPDGSNLTQVTNYNKYDVRWPSLDSDRIIFQYGMDIVIHHIRSGEQIIPDIYVPSDLYVSRTKFINPEKYLTSWSLSEKGLRLLVAARGEIFTLPVKASGLIRQWTYSSGTREKHPVFIPESDGAVLTISDHFGEDQLVRLEKSGGDFSLIENSPNVGWKLRPEISPDGKMCAFSDHTFTLFIINMSNGKKYSVDNSGWEIVDYSWSPDSRYLAYTTENDNLLLSIHIFDTKTKDSHLISDVRFSTYSPAWDPKGRYLYCVTDRNFNAYQDYNRGLFYFDNLGTLALYRLSYESVSPFAARGDESQTDNKEPHDKDFDKKKDEDDSDDAAPIIIDFVGLDQRMEPIPVRAGNYSQLTATDNKLLYIRSERGGINGGREQKDYQGPFLMQYNFSKRETSNIATKVNGYTVSFDLSTIVVRSEKKWYWGDPEAENLQYNDDHRINTDDWSLEVTPREEWPQILHEAWRLQRDFFYDAGMHGVDWEDILAMYEPMLDRITTRDDLKDLIREIQSELQAGHAYIGNGDQPYPKTTSVGFLGADLIPDHKSEYYRIAGVLNPEPGTKDGSSPLLQTDANFLDGTYLLAVNGRQTNSGLNILRLFQDTAGKEIALQINEKPTLKGSREIIVKTLPSEYRLRYLNWVKQNREYVLEKSGGKIGYVHLPNMGGNGLSQIGRDYYSQRTMPALIIDDRFNGGGNIAEYFLKILESDVWAFQQWRRGTIDLKPHGGYFGHVSVLCNEETFSDGETFAEAVKLLDIGKLFGERTWGGWIWISARHRLMDNAFISEPEFGGWGLDGKWLIEGHGVEPDEIVVNDPASEILGIDNQLDAAIEYLLEQLDENPKKLPLKPKGKIVK